MCIACPWSLLLFFFFTETASPEIYTLSLHDALPIFTCAATRSTSTRTRSPGIAPDTSVTCPSCPGRLDRKSTRLNSSHSQISYAVFCLKKKLHACAAHHRAASHSVRQRRAQPH